MQVEEFFKTAAFEVLRVEPWWLFAGRHQSKNTTEVLVG